MKSVLAEDRQTHTGRQTAKADIGGKVREDDISLIDENLTNLYSRNKSFD